VRIRIRTMKAKNKKKNTLLLLVVAMMATLTLWGVYGYALMTIKAKAEDAARLSDELEQYISNEGKVNQIKRSVINTEEERRKLNRYFVDFDAVPKFAKTIEGLKDAAGLALVTINNISDPKNDILLVSFYAEGSFGGLMRLVELVESLPFNIEITRVYLNKVEDVGEDSGKEEGVWHGVFDIEVVGFLTNNSND